MKGSVIQFSQRSWPLATRDVQAHVTARGGHVGPVSFRLRSRWIQPFAVAPWHGEKLPDCPALLRVLRGDFFCLPFGENTRAFAGESHPPHGETANAAWRRVSLDAAHGHFRLQTRVRSGRVDKHVLLRAGHTAVYQQHVVHGMSGPMNFGHHAMLRFPDREASGVVSTSAFRFGQVAPRVFESPEKRGYQSLRPGATFRSLRRVPLLNGGHADLRHYPARRGFEDLVMLVGDHTKPFAWTAVTFPQEGYVWFALKDPRVLAHTILWHSNGGRHYAPWNGRNLNSLGLEEVTSYFHYGLADSAGRNPLRARRIPTAQTLRRDRPLVVNYIMAVAPIPRGFDQVASITPARDRQSVVLRSRQGSQVRCAIDVEFLHGPALS